MHRRNFLQHLLLLPLAAVGIVRAANHAFAPTDDPVAPSNDQSPAHDHVGLARWQRAARMPIVDLTTSDPAPLHFLARAIAENQPVCFRYAGGELPHLRREITPGALFRVDGYPGIYVSGYCHLQQAERTFLVERMTDLAPAELNPIIYGPLDDSPLSTTAAAVSEATVERHNFNDRPTE